jgi:AcrR family transcriptional regulator
VPKPPAARGAKAPTKPRPRPERPPAAPARREEVLEAALELVAEHGVTGASLRMLAKRLKMSQPSLYHYFPSKDALIAEVLDYSTSRMLGKGSRVPPPANVEGLARFARDLVLELYATDSHPRFVRFLFSVAVESKQHRPLVERVFEERLRPGFGLLAGALAQSPAERAYIEEVLRMIVYSLGFMLLDERALLAHAAPSENTLRYADWVLGAADKLLAGRPR